SRRPGAGHVRRQGGRAGDPRRHLLRPTAPLHLGPARVADPDRPAAAAPAAADLRGAPVAAEPAERVRLPAALPARVPQMLRGAGARGAPAREPQPPRSLLADAGAEED